jgi:hypothetical protein
VTRIRAFRERKALVVLYSPILTFPPLDVLQAFLLVTEFRIKKFPKEYGKVVP